MSLRHEFPAVDLPEFRREVEPNRAVPVMRKPTEVNFRSGRDMTEIAQSIIGKHTVRVVAAVGAGKSTKLPLALVQAMGKPLLHVVPSKLLAVAQYDWLSRNESAVEYKLSIDGTEEYSKSGITIASSASVCARLLAKANVDHPLDDVLIYLDESHESDAYTYTLQKIVHCLPGVSGVIFASACHEPGRLPMRETDGEIKSQRFSPKEKPKDWNPSDVGKPWSLSSFDGAALLFVDQKTAAENLVSAYNLAGATAYRLTAKMSVQTFRAAMKDCSDQTTGIVVLVADYSFRSGFTFDVSTIVDSGMVGFQQVVDGKQKVSYRQMYELEKYQAQGRGGRTKGSECVSHYPVADYEQYLCRLEEVEMDAACVMFRCLGYAPPQELLPSKFYKGLIPKDMVQCFNADVALSVQAESDMWPMVHVTQEQIDKNHQDDMAAVVQSYMTDTSPRSSTLFKSMDLTAPDSHSVSVADPLGLLRELTDIASTAVCVTPPNYYMVPGLHYAVVSTRLYGHDYKKCVSDITYNPHVVAGFSSKDSKEIVAMLLNSYNLLNAHVVGLSYVVEHKEELYKAASLYPDLVGSWAEQIQDSVRKKTLEMRAVASIINQVKPANMHLRVIEPMEDMQMTVAKAAAGDLMAAIKKASAKVDTGSYQDEMAKRLQMPEFKPVVQDSLNMSDSNPLSAKVSLTKGKIGDRMVMTVDVKPNGVEYWTDEEFADVIMSACAQRNYNVKTVNKLRLPDYVNSARKRFILHKVREASPDTVDNSFKMVHT